MRHTLLLALTALLLATLPSSAIGSGWYKGSNVGKFQSQESAQSKPVYIVSLSTAPSLSEYRGGIAGYPATATWDDGSTDEDGSGAPPEMILTADAGAEAARQEAMDLDYTNCTPHAPPSAADAVSSTQTSATASASDQGNTRGRSSGTRRHRMNLGMDRPQVAAFASLLQRQQARVASEVGILDTDMLYSYKHISNGFAARLTPRQAWQLKRHPAVASVQRSRVFTPQTIDSPKFLGLPGKVWPALGGQSKAGDGTVIGVIDSGIWPEHPSFSDKGFSASRPATWKGKCEQSQTFKCNNKLIGARAFYAAFGRPVLDNDWLTPRDAGGHGTWCASAAAGNAVAVEGGKQISGMAPGARIAVYKVLCMNSDGKGGANGADIGAAINQAVADGVDVLSLSLSRVGSDQSFFNDLGYLRANAAGVFVTLSAGNRGPAGSKKELYRTIGSFCPWYITVGASTISQGDSLASVAGTRSLSLDSTSTATATPPSPSAPVVADFSSRGPLLEPNATASPPNPANVILKPDIIALGVDLMAAAPGKKVGDQGTFVRALGTSMATPHIAGLAALIIQKYPNWSPAQVMSAMMTTATVTGINKRAIQSATGGDATPWEMGAGHMFPPTMLNPGLTYDARESDYRNFLAGQDMTRAKKEFPGASLSPLAVRNLNLPTVTLPRLQGSVQVTRTVTNVGTSKSKYTVSGLTPQGVSVAVGPPTLTLAPGQKGNYEMTFKVITPSQEFKYGYIVWTDDQGHSVRSPLVVQPVSR